MRSVISVREDTFAAPRALRPTLRTARIPLVTERTRCASFPHTQDMTETIPGLRIRPLDELDISDIVTIDEKIGGRYRPEVWERRIGYYLRRDPDSCVVAESGGKLIGFMLGEIRSGE